MARPKWETTFRLRGRAGAARAVVALLFWLWGGGGLFINGGSLIFLKGDVGVGTSAYMAAATLLWIGGMVLFGFGALIMPGDFVGQRNVATADASDNVDAR